jgi:hypothetical protein
VLKRSCYPHTAIYLQSFDLEHLSVAMGKAARAKKTAKSSQPHEPGKATVATPEEEPTHLAPLNLRRLEKAAVDEKKMLQTPESFSETSQSAQQQLANLTPSQIMELVPEDYWLDETQHPIACDCLGCVILRESLD